MQRGPDGTPSEASSIYVFKSMDRNVGYRHLKMLADDLPNIAQIKETGQALWLLRESNTQKGMLTVDYIFWDNKINNWYENSTRMALHPIKGWVNASNVDDPSFKEAMATISEVNSETAEKHQGSLETYLSTLPYTLTITNRMNPTKQEQANQGIYTGYVTVGDDKPTHKVSVPLIPATTQAITCELSGKVFKNPVVLTKNITIPGQGGISIQLNKGKSYEKAELEKIGVDSAYYFVNFVLQKIINRLGCGDNALMNNLSHAWLIDPVMLETLEDPYILPSGHSLSKETINGMIASGRTLRCPQTQAPFTKDLVPNINLDRFIKAWPTCQEQLIESINTRQRSPIKPKSKGPS
jgi:hypothetical protein